MILEMHEEEEVDSRTGTLIKEHPSLLQAVGETIVLVGGILMVLQEVPTYHLIQGLQSFPSHIVSAPLIEACGDIPSRPLHYQGLEKHVDLEQQPITA